MSDIQGMDFESRSMKDLLTIIDDYVNRLLTDRNERNNEIQNDMLGMHLIPPLKRKLERLGEAEFLEELEKAVDKYGTLPPGKALLATSNPFCAYEQEAIKRNLSATLLLPKNSPWVCGGTGLRSSSWDPITEADLPKKNEGGKEGGRKRKTRRRRKTKSRRRR